MEDGDLLPWETVLPVNDVWLVHLRQSQKENDGEISLLQTSLRFPPEGSHLKACLRPACTFILVAPATQGQKEAGIRASLVWGLLSKTESIRMLR